MVTKALQLPLYWEGCAQLFLWTLGSAVYCRDCNTLCPTSRIRRADTRMAKKSSQHFALLSTCTIMFHSQYYLVATAIHIHSTRIYIYIYIYIHTHTNTHILHSIDAGRVKYIRKNGTAGNVACQGNLPACREFVIHGI